MNIIAVYRPPYHNNLTRFTSDIDDILKSIPILETTVIGGDININLISPDNSERAFVEVMFSSSFDQHITVPTRVTETTSTLIDHIWSNSIDRIVSGVFDAGISDHHITIYHKFRDHSDQCIDELEKSLIDKILLPDNLNAQWEEYGNCDQKFSLFSMNFIKFRIKAAQLGRRFCLYIDYASCLRQLEPLKSCL